MTIPDHPEGARECLVVVTPFGMFCVEHGPNDASGEFCPMFNALRDAFLPPPAEQLRRLRPVEAD